MTDDKKTAQNQDVKKKQIPKGKGKSKQLEEQLKRALADYQNLERRVDEERRLLGQLSSAILIEKFLPVLDNLENAKKHIDDQGLEMVINQFKDVLKTEGVEEIIAEGSKFDPNLHEATEVVEGQNDGIIARVIRKGYKINNKVLRPTQVIVERSQVNQNTEEKAEEHTNVYE